MNSRSSATRCRAVAVWLLTSGVGATLLRWLAPDLSGSMSHATFDEVLVQGCAVAAALCAVWAWIVTSVIVSEVLRRSPTTVRGVPDWARHVVLMACGVAAVSLASPSAAATSAGIDVDGLPLPDRVSGGFLVETVRPELPRTGSHSDPSFPNPSRPHRVVAGESLWSVAADELGDPARWHEIYELNRQQIGPDPGLIEVATPLDLPRTR